MWIKQILKKKKEKYNNKIDIYEAKCDIKERYNKNTMWKKM